MRIYAVAVPPIIVVKNKRVKSYQFYGQRQCCKFRHKIKRFVYNYKIKKYYTILANNENSGEKKKVISSEEFFKC